MTPTRYARLAGAVTAAALFAALAGCSRDDPAKAVAAMNTSNIQRLANLYTAFQHYHGGQGPQDEAEFTEFIKQFNKDRLKMMGIDPDNPATVFVSERDGKPFTVRYGVRSGRGSSAAVVFEQVGTAGKRQVAFTGGKVEEVDDAVYQHLLAGNKSFGPGPAVGGPGTRANHPTRRPEGAPTKPPGS